MNVSKEQQDLKIVVSERTKPFVFWTGAGLSCPVIPSWGGLRDQLIIEAKNKADLMPPGDKINITREIKSIAEQSSLWVQLGRLKAILGVETFTTEIKRIIGVSNDIDVPHVYELIWSLAPSGLITFNLDLFSQRASASHPRKYNPIAIRPGTFAGQMNFLKERRPFIAHPHGHLDEPSQWAFTNSDLDRVLSDSAYLEWLNILFRSAVVVFVGITADDIAISDFIKRIKDKSGCDLTGNYWITDRIDNATDAWANSQGIRVIRYQNVDGAHRELCEILRDIGQPLKEEDDSKQEPVVFLGTTQTENIISAPDVLVTFSEEDIRNSLNIKASKIMRNTDIVARDIEYQRFLSDYGRSIHRSWYASTSDGENEFLGYRLLREVTGGAFGTVYEALASDGQQVAIKVLKPENFRRIEFFRNFRRGVNSLRIIDTRKVDGVVGFIDAAEIPPTLIMDWVDGQTLNDLVEARQLLNWDSRVKVALELSSIIRDAHNLPERVLHRDLRPANIIIDDYYADPNSWRVVVLDFDLSWHKGAEDHSIMHSPAFGYLAPEQRKKMAKQTTRSALVDSYGFGMTLYFLCTGKNPFPDQHLLNNWDTLVFSEVCRQPFGEWLSLPKRLARLIINSTKDDQASRWSMLQLQGELDGLNRIIRGDRSELLIDTVIEELAARTEHMSGYQWSDSESEALLSRPNGLALSLKASLCGTTILLKSIWNNSGDQDWTQIDRVIQKGIPRFIQTLQDGKWKVSQHKVYRGFSIAAEIDHSEISKNPTSAGKLLDRAIGYATTISSF